MKYLCCDLGGTSADWGVFDNAEKAFVFRTTIPTNEYDDFYEMLDHLLLQYKKYMAGGEHTIENATFGVAGPTDHNRVVLTNIEGWDLNTITTNSILQEHGHHGFSSIINDFEALGYGVLYLLENGPTKQDLEHVYGRFRSGPVRPGEEIGSRSIVCGPGTGLGVACLVDGLEKDGFPYIFSSEGGHHSIAPETNEQYRLLSNSGVFHGKRSYESALSHVGLRNMYNFFRREDYGAEPNYSILSNEILLLANNGQDQAANDAIELFSELLANFCGNMALTFNCDKAVFLWGGALRNMPIDLIKTRFKRHFSDRCSHGDRVARVPVVLLNNKDIPLLGCAYRSEYEVEFLKPKA